MFIAELIFNWPVSSDDMMIILFFCIFNARSLAIRILSVCQMRALWQNGRKLCLDYERTFILVFWEGEWLVGVATPSTWNFGSTGPHWSEIADFELINLAKKFNFNTNRKSTLRFPMSLRWSLYVAPNSPKGGLKNANRPFFLYNCTSLEESLLQSFFVWKLSAATL